MLYDLAVQGHLCADGAVRGRTPSIDIQNGIAGNFTCYSLYVEPLSRRIRSFTRPQIPQSGLGHLHGLLERNMFVDIIRMKKKCHSDSS
jgi:hypothetical protein